VAKDKGISLTSLERPFTKELLVNHRPYFVPKSCLLTKTTLPAKEGEYRRRISCLLEKILLIAKEG
jgi:hypothetical protein